MLVKYGKHWLSKNVEGWEAGYKTVRKGINEKNIAQANRGRDLDAIAMMQYIEKEGIDDPILSGILHAFKYEKTYFDKITNAIGPLLDKLITGSVAEILSPDYSDESDDRKIIDWEEVIREEAVVYIGLDALTDSEIASIVGSAMFSDLTSYAGRKYKFGVSAGLPNIGKKKGIEVIIHGDEFDALVGGSNMITLLNKSRGAEFMLNLYTQTWWDVEANLGSAAKAGQIAGNLSNSITMRVQDVATAEMLTKQLPETNVNTLMAVSGVDDGYAGAEGSGIGFKSRNEDRISTIRVPMITPSDVVGLPQGQAFALLSGSHLYKIRIPVMKQNTAVEYPSHIKEMVADMRRNYTSREGWYQYTDSIDLSKMMSIT